MMVRMDTLLPVGFRGTIRLPACRQGPGASRRPGPGVLSTGRMARALALGLLLVAAVATAAGARETDDATSHRRFDDPAYWSTVFDDPSRAAWQKPDELVAALGLK